jgi:predicted CXXCH cytochrome family protein
MRSFLAVLATVFVAALAATARAEEDGCGVCHGEKRVQFEGSIHRSVSLGCVGCHGGDSSVVESKELAHSAAKGYRGKIGRRDVPQACGECHADIAKMRPFGLRTDALAAYRTSHHGKALLEKGLEDAAVCTDCHGVHDVKRVKDASSPAFRQNVPATCGKCHADAVLMKKHGIESHAVEDFATSVHGLRLASGEPGVPSCADCHDAHASSPPGATEVADVCGSCHRETRDRFLESPHAAASKRGSMRQCITCHGNHAVSHPDYSLFDAKTDAAGESHGGTRCLSCHDADKPDDKGAQAAIAFGKGLRTADTVLNEATARVDAIEADGFHVDYEREALDRARRELVRVVPLAHTADRPRVEGALRRVGSLAGEAVAGCEAKVREERDRRIFGSVAGAVLLGVAGVLGLRRRAARKE